MATTPIFSGATSYAFDHWSGDASGTSNSTSVTMSGARNVTANYNTWVLSWDTSNSFSAQYSDPTGLKAVLTINGLPASGVAIHFSVGTDLSSPDPTTNGSGVATDPTNLSQPSGSSYTATASCAACGALTITNPYTITKEYVDLDYTGDSAKTVSGGTVTFLMNAALTESDTNYGTQLGTVSVMFTLKVSGGGSSVGTCTSTVSTAGQATGKAVTVGCTIPPISVTVPTLYDVELTLVPNNYYDAGVGLGSADAIFSVPGYTTGGGWFYEPLSGVGTGPRVNFGITATYQDARKKTGARGNANIIRHGLFDLSTLHPSLPAGVADYNFQIKSNSTTQFTITCTGTPQVCTSTFTGKVTVKAINRATGVSYDVGTVLGGNVQFQIDVTDGGEPGSSPGVGPDKFAARVWNASSTILNLDSVPDATYTGTNQIFLNGGNIQVRQ